MTASDEIRGRLFELRDEGYGAFQSRLVPTVSPERIIGVRIPELRRLAKEISGREEAASFLSDLPHTYYDENNLHGLMISAIKLYDDAIAALDRFLPHVDNWATCDLMRPKIFTENTERLISDIRRWIGSDHTYTVRFGLEMLMVFYLDESFSAEYLEDAARVTGGKYYLDMMKAWFFATALSKRYDETVSYIEQNRLDRWTHNKTIQKAVESLSVSDKRKAYLKTLKRR